MSVDKWMSKRLITVNQDDPASLAFELLLTNDIRHLPVVGQHNTLVGILTDRDLHEAVVPADPSRSTRSMYHTVRNIKIRKIMTPNPVTVGAQAPIREAAQILLDRKIDCLPVINADGRLAGILTSTDILEAFVEFTRILGSSRRIDVQMESEDYPKVREAFEKQQVSVVSVGITHEETNGKTVFSFRTEDTNISKITRKLASMGYQFILDN